jgi:uncharacterized protein (TIGR01777 family)
MKILISGSHGLIGKALCLAFQRNSHEVLSLGRYGTDLTWKDLSTDTSGSNLNGVQAIIHLAGENIAARRWTCAQKQRILSSRIELTRLLSERAGKAMPPPALFISASAVGFYGDRADEWLSEESLPGDGFLSDVCRQWEESAFAFQQSGTRVIHLRLGMVLSKFGGAFPKLLTPFRWRIGGRIGSGKQYISWIMLEDVVRAVDFLFKTTSISGPVNVVSPYPCQNQELTRGLSTRLHRPALFPLPAMVLRLLLGRMADELLLASSRVQPSKLISAGFQFDFPGLDDALDALI